MTEITIKDIDGDEYTSAVKVWGKPDFIHMRWDRRSQREIQQGDTIILAKGDWQFSQYNAPDILEK